MIQYVRKAISTSTSRKSGKTNIGMTTNHGEEARIVVILMTIVEEIHLNFLFRFFFFIEEMDKDTRI